MVGLMGDWKKRLSLACWGAASFLLLSCSGPVSSDVPRAQGDISSAGGDIYGDSLNPWFLENTREVSYCIEVDPAHFHLSLSRITSIVAEAIESWKKAYEGARRDWYAPGELVPFGQVRVATQTFVKEKCRLSTQLRFQFGTLAENQISDPTRVVATATRTEYDRVNLRGRGFIYIAPDSGPLKPDMASEVWSFGDGIVLKRVLLHELGHVFGLSHSGTAYELMGAAQPEYIVQKSTLANLRRSPLPAVKRFLSRVGVFGFQFPWESEVCDPPDAIFLGVRETDLFFGFPDDMRCRKFRFLPDSVEVFAAPKAVGGYRLIGKTKPVSSPGSSRVLQRVKLPPEQRVFSRLPKMAAIGGYLDGPAAVTRRVFRTTYESTDGTRSGFLKATLLPDQLIEMEVIWKNQVVDVFDHG